MGLALIKTMFYITNQTYFLLPYFDFLLNFCVTLFYGLLISKNNCHKYLFWYHRNNINKLSNKAITFLNNNLFNFLTITTCLLCVTFIFNRIIVNTTSVFSNNLFHANALNYATIIVLLLITSFMLYANLNNTDYNNMPMEFNLLLVLAMIGLFALIQSVDLLSFYVSLELQTLCLISLCSLKVTNLLNIESAIKLYLLSSVSSGLLILSIAGLFFSTGFTNLIDLFDYNLFKYNVANTNIIWLWVFNTSLIWKIGSAPIHLWFVDIVVSSRILPIMFFTITPKIALFTFLCSKYNQFVNVSMFNLVIIFVVSCLILSPVSALIQTNIKAVIAFSSIAQTGFILTALYLSQFYAAWLNLILYNLTLLFIWLVLNLEKTVIYTTNLNIFVYFNNWYLLNWIIVAIVLAGLPIVCSFAGKLFVINSVINSGYFFPIIIILFSSILSVTYGIKIIQNLFSKSNKIAPYNFKYDEYLNGTISFVGSFILCVFWYIKPIYNLCLICFF